MRERCGLVDKEHVRLRRVGGVPPRWHRWKEPGRVLGQRSPDPQGCSRPGVRTRVCEAAQRAAMP